MSTEVFVIDPAQGNKPVKVGNIGADLPQATEKFVQDNKALGANPAKITPQQGKNIVVYPNDPGVRGKLLDKYDPQKKISRQGDIPGAYELKDDGSKKNEFTPSRP